MRTAALVVIGMLMIGLARADGPAESGRKPIRIPPQELQVALQAVGEVEGLRMVFLSEDVAHRNTHGVSGNLTYSEALEQLLRDTGLTYRFLDPHTVMILPVSAVPGAPVQHPLTSDSQNNTGNGVGASAGSRAGLTQVTITARNGTAGTPGEQSSAAKEARRAELYPKVSEFLTEVAALEPPLVSSKLEFPTRGALPAWGLGICPQVMGLARQDGVFLLTRLLEIAHTVNAPIAKQQCKPNFHIFVTDQPKAVFEAVEKRNPFNSFAVFGSRGVPYLLDQFIATPRPVKVWYNISGLSIEGVLVLVDRTRVQGVSLDQLAQYIAMVGFAEIKPDADPGNAPTILKLFAGPPQDAPRGLSDWDEAFLRSLNSYEGPFRRGIARSDRLALSMVGKIVP